MPGISVVHRPNALDADVEPLLDALRFDDDYAVDVYHRSDDALVAATAYPSYPIRRFEAGGWTLVLEGLVYDVDDDRLSTELARLARWAHAGDDEPLERWLSTHDAEFVLVGVHPSSGSLVALTDALGRLPLYHTSVGDAAVLSREPKFARELRRRELGCSPTVDRLGVAQTMTFGYRLGARTLFEGVERVPPGSCFRLDAGERERAFRFDLGGEPNADSSVDANAERLADRFVEACRKRARPETETVVSLSGGLDSRAVLGGYVAADVPVSAATFERIDAGTDDDVRVAREVAAAVDVPWTSYRSYPRRDAERRLLDEMQGENSLVMAFILDFLEQVTAAHGPVIMVTGDGGDKAFPVISPSRTFENVEELAAYVLDAESVVDAGAAARTAGVDRGALVESVCDRLRSYPESSLRDRYVHFLVRERGINWLNSGEDRNRYHCWSTSPFYALPFFLDAMSCPTDQKRGSELYLRFIEALEPALVDVEYADFGAPAGSREYALKRRVYDLLSSCPPLKRRVVGLVASSGAADADLRNRVRTLLLRSEAVDRAFDSHELEQLLDSDRVPATALYDVLTVLRLADDIDGSDPKPDDRPKHLCGAVNDT